MINDKSGFTLLEFLVAMIILIIGLLGMLQGINLALSQNTKTALRNEAISVADELMTKTRTDMYSNINDISAASMPREFTVRKFRNTSTHFIVTQAVQTVTSSAFSPSRSKEIVVDVMWNYKNTISSHSVSSVVSKSN